MNNKLLYSYKKQPVILNSLFKEIDFLKITVLDLESLFQISFINRHKDNVDVIELDFKQQILRIK